MIAYTKSAIDFLEKPQKPTKEFIKQSNRWMDYADKELEEELTEAMEGYKEEMQEFKEAPQKGYKDGLLVDPRTYRYKEALMLPKENLPDNGNSTPLGLVTLSSD